MRVLIIFGTRPEAIKMAPLVTKLSQTDGVEVGICVTAQHRQMLDQVLELFGIQPHYDLDIMRDGQGLGYITAEVITRLKAVFASFRPDWVIVQGDTSTTFAGALAAFYEKVKVAHVEAGLRTGNIESPWPEEMNRILTTRLSALHFAPTEDARGNLEREGVPGDRIVVTGNTVIDALFQTLEKIDADAGLRSKLDDRFPFLSDLRGRKLILATGHRRENFGGGLERMCRALARLADREDVVVAYPVHLNPVVQEAANKVLHGRTNVHLLPPQDYLPFVRLMRSAHFIISDSGGIQEEAPSIGKPVLVTRDTTERPEAVAAGTVALVGTDVDAIVRKASQLLDDPRAYEAMSFAHNPYGDGHASERITERILQEGL
ncbi:UDP-N-acetylglucosamine 2-epimerase [Chelatococcus caeni]|uniref:UDP-N-acetylglucosamine 2-epimerase (non-hydrolyzing) n=1 Tax=Chelatococcus caeni TaxID=1348468 RepID=A0A840BRH4_9HYPH|nr:UDP-N-acetylglucosamine 2-epimerase (non-hydrolyzing) [Chelatococcus caeni]MBB4016041.1 UDP-N-acetylglucosamine 2-epimerase [Chelatococcus caeni]